MIIALIVIIVIVVLALQGCNNNPKPPDPDPDPDPDKPKWSDYFPKGWYVPPADWSKHKWIYSDYESELWTNYCNLIDNWNENLEKLSIAKGEISDGKLWTILSQKHPKGGYLYKWTSDLDIYDLIDHWASPEIMHEYKKDKDGNRDDIYGKYRDDCDGFARYHNQYLFETCNYWCSLFVEVYWQRRYFNKVSDKYEWKSLGHAITLYKETPESDWKCFSNQTWLSASGGQKDIKDYVFKFVPVNDPRFADDYILTRVRARHPIEGNLLFEVKGDDLV